MTVEINLRALVGELIEHDTSLEVRVCGYESAMRAAEAWARECDDPSHPELQRHLVAACRWRVMALERWARLMARAALADAREPIGGES